MTYALVKGVRVDIFEEAIKRVLFGTEYMGTMTIDKFEYHIIIAQNRFNMMYVEHKVLRVDMAR